MITGGRAECLDDAELEAVASGLEVAEVIERHLRDCGECRRRIEQVKQNNAFLESIAPKFRKHAAGVSARASCTIPDYEIVAEIQQGGQGVIYEARRAVDGQRVALKVLRGGVLATSVQRRRFEREIELASELRHPHIVTIIERGYWASDQPYYAMEYIEGVSLREYGHRVRTGGCDEALRIFVLICEAIAYAHQRGVIHRDLKPGNVLVDETGAPRVLDFGVAKSIGEPARLRLTRTEDFVGTLAYSAPEQVTGSSGDVDTRTDVYSLGILLYELLTGKLPYSLEGSEADVRNTICYVDPHPLTALRPDLDGKLEIILLRSLAKDRARRYQSAGELARDIKRYLNKEPIEAERDSRWYLLRATLRKHRMLVMSTLCLFFALMTVAVTFNWLWHQARTERDRATHAVTVGLSIVEKFVHELDTHIVALPGSVSVRESLVQTLSEAITDLEEYAESGSAPDYVVAGVEMLRGDLAYLRGTFEIAAAHYARCVELNGEVASGRDASAREIRLLARSHRKLAVVAGEHASFEQSITILEQLLDDDRDAETQLELCTTLLTYARESILSGYYERIEQPIERALELADSKAHRDDSSEVWTARLAEARELEGDVHLALGNCERGFGALQEARDLADAWHEEHPHDLYGMRRRMRVHVKLGRTLDDGGHVEEAQAAFEIAVQIGTSLMETDPTVALWQRDLCAAHTGLFILKSKRGNETAATHSEALVELARALVNVEAGNREWLRMQGFAYMLTGRMLGARGERTSALASFEAARIIRTRLLDQQPTSPALRSELATTYDRLADVSQDLGKSDLARTYHEKAVTACSGLASEHPRVVPLMAKFTWILNNAARWHINEKTDTHNREASSLIEQAETTLRTMLDEPGLRGCDQKYHAWLEKIQKNRRILEKRAAAGDS